MFPILVNSVTIQPGSKVESLDPIRPRRVHPLTVQPCGAGPKAGKEGPYESPKLGFSGGQLSSPRGFVQRKSEPFEYPRFRSAHIWQPAILDGFPPSKVYCDIRLMSCVMATTLTYLPTNSTAGIRHLPTSHPSIHQTSKLYSSISPTYLRALLTISPSSLSILPHQRSFLPQSSTRPISSSTKIPQHRHQHRILHSLPPNPHRQCRFIQDIDI